MLALKTILVGAAACAAVIAAPALAAPPASSTAVEDTEGVKVMSVHGDRVAYRDEGAGEVIDINEAYDDMLAGTQHPRRDHPRPLDLISRVCVSAADTLRSNRTSRTLAVDDPY